MSAFMGDTDIAKNPLIDAVRWIPDSRAACYRAALCADPLAAPE
jgi:hypothetical protein